MRYYLFATAGHVDHGKTSLIKALTGIDTDRLPEEKRRGLSIDLGFAYLDFPDIRVRLEFIDVPGHERFIKNAIAGIVSAKGLLLVVDVTEGVKPQTLEHLRVAKALGIDRGVVALSKVDKVDKELLSERRRELEEILEKEGFNLPIVSVSVLTMEGIEELKDRLKSIIKDFSHDAEDKPLRVFIDSAFVVKGFGTVVRGSCVEGKLKEGEEVSVEPYEIVAKVRKLQNHGSFVKEVVAGERVAVNLPGLDKDKVERGAWLLEPGSYIKSKESIISTELKLKPSARYSVFCGMMETQGRIRKISEGTYLLRIEREIVLKRGDRIVVLNSSGRLLGGAHVLHPYPKIRRKEFIKERLYLLKNSFELYLLEEWSKEGLSAELFRRLTGEGLNPKNLIHIAYKIEGRFFSIKLIERLKGKLKELLQELSPETGLRLSMLQKSLGVSYSVLRYLLRDFENFTIEGNALFKRTEEASNQRAMEELTERLSEDIVEEKCLLSEGVEKIYIQRAVKEGLVHDLGNGLLISDGLLKSLVMRLRELGDEFSLQEAKAKLGLTRKYLIPLLEYLDYMGLTVRRGNRRIWKRSGRGW